MGRLAQVCKLPLSLSGALRTPWIPQASSFLVAFVAEGFFGLIASNSRFLPLELSRLTTPQPLRRPHNTTPLRLSRCCPTASWVCTLPLTSSGEISAPWLPNQAPRLPLIFLRSPRLFPERFPTIRFSSRLRSGAGPYRDLRSAPDGLLKCAGYLCLLRSEAAPPESPISHYEQFGFGLSAAFPLLRFASYAVFRMPVKHLVCYLQ